MADSSGVVPKVEPYDGSYSCLICTGSVRAGGGQAGGALHCTQCTVNPFHRACAGATWESKCPQCGLTGTLVPWARGGGQAHPPGEAIIIEQLDLDNPDSAAATAVPLHQDRAVARVGPEPPDAGGQRAANRPKIGPAIAAADAAGPPGQKVQQMQAAQQAAAQQAAVQQAAVQQAAVQRAAQQQQQQMQSGAGLQQPQPQPQPQAAQAFPQLTPQVR